MDDVVSRFSAYFEHQTSRVRAAIVATCRGQRYNFAKHQNDLLDSEQLVYLADERLHFVTCDKGFEQLKSGQEKQVSVVTHEEFASYRSTRLLLERLMGCAAAARS
jgi:hypothetical protein